MTVITVRSRVAIALAIAGVGLGCQDPLREYEKRYAAERKAQREASMKHRSESRVRLQAMLKERGVRDSVARTTERMRPDPACWRAVAAVTSRCYQFTVEDAGYTVEIEPDGPRGTDFVKRIRVHDDSALIVYDESFITPNRPSSSM